MDIVRLKEIVEDIKGRTGEDDMTIDNNTITKLGNISFSAISLAL